MVDIHQIPGNNLRLQVHDELCHELTEQQMHILPDIKRIMERVYTPKNGMGLTVSIKKSAKSLAYWDMESIDV
jgi:DNA polymerase I-like protein with 3'-5' exonuclease and polymerase domains